MIDEIGKHSMKFKSDLVFAFKIEDCLTDTVNLTTVSNLILRSHLCLSETAVTKSTTLPQLEFKTHLKGYRKSLSLHIYLHSGPWHVQTL